MHHFRRRVLALLGRPSRFVRYALLLTVLAVVAIVVGTLGRNPDLSHVRVAVLSGSKDGNYYATVAKAAEAAKRQRGRIDNIESAGSVENITRLAAAKHKCDVQFALVQEGIPWPESHPFRLVGRLPTSESFVVLGRDRPSVIVRPTTELHLAIWDREGGPETPASCVSTNSYSSGCVRHRP